MTILIDTAPTIDLAMQDMPHLVEALRDDHGLYSPLLQRREQRQAAHTSLQGLLSALPRKSIAPMGLALEGVNPNAVRALQAFMSAGAWDDDALLAQHWKEVEKDLGEDEGVLLVDGSDVPTQGDHAVGVKRQYGGELGQRANCQAGGCVGSASQHGSTLLDRRLSLPQEWVNDAAYAERRTACGIPAHGVFTTKPMLRWAMIQAVVQAGTLRCRWVTCAEACGRDTTLLETSARRGLWDDAEVPHDPCVWRERPATAVPRWAGRGRRPTRQRLGEGQPKAQTVVMSAASLPAEAWTRHTIKEGSQGPMVADVAAVRVRGGRDGLPGPAGWVVLRRHVEPGELKPSLRNAPAATAWATLVRLRGMRWPIETCCADGKHLWGMGDDAVRSWAGWHHHMPVVMLAHFFVVRLRLK